MVMRRRSLLKCAGAVLAGWLALYAPPSFSADQPPPPSLSILYPKHESAVGQRVNVVLDPLTDWSAAPFFQVLVGSTELPVMDASGGRHAMQGVSLAPGMNTITVRALAPAPKDAKREGGKLTVLSSRTLAVFNRAGSFVPVSSSFEPQFFHTRENEADCSGCHRLDAEQQDLRPKGPDDVLCSSCHRGTSTGKHIHGPAGVGSCLSCHDPDLFPVKYQFDTVDPWQITKTTAQVEPAVFTISAEALFRDQRAGLLSDSVPPLPKPQGKRDPKKEEELRRKRDAEIAELKSRQRDLFRPFLEYVKQNPGDRIRVESHVDAVELPAMKNKNAKGYRSHQQLTAARAKALEKLLAEQGISGKERVVFVSMGSSLPKAPNTTAENRTLNNRIEIVVYPPDVKVRNSQKLPILADRQRVIVNIAYSQGSAEAKDLKVIEQLPKGIQYVKRTGIFRGNVLDPATAGDELVWTLGNPGGFFQESLSYVVRMDRGAKASVSPVIRIRFLAGSRERTREFDPKKPQKNGLTIPEACGKCHGDMLAGTFSHGPAAAGLCTLCHDPHAGDHPAWTRKQSWMLCTTCHEEKKTEVHVIRGFVRNVSHPTGRYRDPSRPGRRLTCVSCHSPHSADTPDMLKFGARNKFDLCGVCHPKK